MALILTSFWFILQPVALGEAEAAVPLLKGTYQGGVFNGDDLTSVLTIFSSAEDGTASGTYAMTEDDGLEIGSLSNFKWEGDHVLVCTWKDKYGTGILRLLFSADRSIFKGFWGADSKTTSQPWDGVKLAQGPGA